jgi:hypothetical protein
MPPITTPTTSTQPSNKTSHQNDAPPLSSPPHTVPTYSTSNPAPIKLKTNSTTKTKILRSDLSPSPSPESQPTHKSSSKPPNTPPSPTITHFAKGIPPYSNLSPPTPPEPHPTNKPPSKPPDPQPSPKITHIAKGITSYSNLLPTSTLNKLQYLAENPPCPLKSHGKHHTMGFFAKPKHAPALMYTWGNQYVTSDTWVPLLDETLEKISSHIPTKHQPFNSCLLNVFQNGNNISPRHCDKVQGTNKPDHVVLICLGATRPFLFTHKNNSKNTISINLKHGDVVNIDKKGNAKWLHERPKCPTVDEPSYSLSFRVTPPQNISS